MSSPAVLTFAVIGEGDSPIFEADLAAPPSAAFTDATVAGGDGDDDDHRGRRRLEQITFPSDSSVSSSLS